VGLGQNGSGWRWRWLPARLRRRPGRTARPPAAVRVIVPLALLALIATIAGSAFSVMLARQADSVLVAEQRQALIGAVDALKAVSPDHPEFEPALVRVLEHASGLKGLKFEVDPADGARAVQSVVDNNGRIVGWLSWDAPLPASQVIMRLSPFAVIVALGVIGIAGLSAWQLKRLGFRLADHEQTVHMLEYHDVLTGLPNYRQTIEALDRAIAVRPPERMVGLAVVDLEGLDDMRDSLGDAGGDEAIMEIASRLLRAVPADVMVSRLNGRKFALVMPSTDRAEALAIAGTARDTISRVMWVKQVVQMSASVGFALAPQDGIAGSELMRRSRLALRTVGRRGRGLVVPFAREMEADFAERNLIRQDLSRALAARELVLHYQPIVSAERGTILGVEALLRWTHPSRGAIPPAVFVRVAEETGLMDQLGEFVLRRALGDAARWPGIYMSVNLSPMQVRDQKLVGLVSGLVRETGFEPARLVLEVTESVLIDEPERAKARLEELRKLGVRLALDDFGSGYSSLTYLQRLPFDKLKIDRGFVAALDQSANAGVIIQAIVTLGRALGMSIVIEGVETEEQRVLLRLAGCSEMQGYLFARPSPREDIDRLLQEGAALPPLQRLAS
jgi:diguanylate cyclase (GGDEF)-like protein